MGAVVMLEWCSVVALAPGSAASATCRFVAEHKELLGGNALCGALLAALSGIRRLSTHHGTSAADWYALLRVLLVELLDKLHLVRATQLVQLTAELLRLRRVRVPVRNSLTTCNQTTARSTVFFGRRQPLSMRDATLRQSTRQHTLWR